MHTTHAIYYRHGMQPGLSNVRHHTVVFSVSKGMATSKLSPWKEFLADLAL